AKELGESGKALDAAMDGRLGRLIASGDLAPKAGSTLLAHLDGPLERAVLVSLGDSDEVTEKAYLDAVRGAFKAAGQLAADDAVSLLHEAPVVGRDDAWKLRMQVLVGRELAYRFEALKSKREARPVRPRRVALAIERNGAA